MSQSSKTFIHSFEGSVRKHNVICKNVVVYMIVIVVSFVEILHRLNLNIVHILWQDFCTAAYIIYFFQLKLYSCLLLTEVCGMTVAGQKTFFLFHLSIGRENVQILVFRKLNLLVQNKNVIKKRRNCIICFVPNLEFLF